MMHMFCRCAVRGGRLFIDWTFPANFQQLLKRTGRNTIITSPVVCDGCTSDLKQPLLHTLCATFSINAAYSLHKYLRRQVLSLFTIPHFAIDIAINQTEVLLIKRLKLLHVSPSREPSIAGPPRTLHPSVILSCCCKIRSRLFSAQ